jgi:hypothetical protein
MHDAHKELQEIFVKKNTDYGNSFEESLEKHGLIASIVRMEDKMSRLNTLSKQEALVTDESLIDTLKDLSNYALMSAVWLEQTKKEADFLNKVSQAVTTSPLTVTLDAINPNLAPEHTVNYHGSYNV